MSEPSPASTVLADILSKLSTAPSADLQSLANLVDLQGQLDHIALREAALSILVTLGLALWESEHPGFCLQLVAGLRSAPQSPNAEGREVDALVLDHVQELVAQAQRIEAMGGPSRSSH